MISTNKCFIFDIDSTIAIRGSRSPFDWLRVSEDTVNEPIRDIYKAIRAQNYIVIFLTGRDESCRPATVEWLKDNGFGYEYLYMKPLGEKTIDTEYKAKTYREKIMPYYEVVAVFEDSARCTKLFREVFNLTVLQVAESNR